MPNQAPISGLSGRRAYFRFLYGSHFWQSVTDSDWSRGMIRDTPRISIPPGGLYDSVNFLLHQPGVATKRGGTEYISLWSHDGQTYTPKPYNGITSASYLAAVAYAPFPNGSQLVAVGNDGSLAGYPMVNGRFAGTNTSLSLGSSKYATLDKPKFRLGGSKNLLVVTSKDGTLVPKVYDGTQVVSLGGSPPTGRFAEVYKTRLVLANVPGNENRIFFSPTPDITATWDVAESWIDADYAVTGLAALSNVLLVFSQANLARIIGTTPPPGSDMDMAPLATVGCTDARSISIQDGTVFFANPRGLYFTNGATAPQALTALGGIDNYWQSLFANSYDPATWTISTGIYGQFLYVSIMDGANMLVDALTCYLPARAWWRMTNLNASMFADAEGAFEELYVADRSTSKVIAMSPTFTPGSSGSVADANGLDVIPSIEFRPLGYSPTEKRLGHGLLSYDLQNASTGRVPFQPDPPHAELAITVKNGTEADAILTPAESPLDETGDTLHPGGAIRRRFSICAEATACTVRLDQTMGSLKTAIYSLEVEQRQLPYGELPAND